jgi:hypothetical protein
VGWGLSKNLWRTFSKMADAKPEVVIRRGFWRRWRHFSSEQGPLVRLKATLAVSGHFSTWRQQTGSSLLIGF